MSTSITGQTNAYFTDSIKVSGAIQAGNWASSLKIFNQGLQGDGNHIFAEIKNEGSKMSKNGKYEIYYIETGDPVNGEKLIDNQNRKFNPINENNTRKITYKPSKGGIYRFKVYEEDDEKNAIWSEPIKFKSKEDQKVLNEEQKQTDLEKPEEDVKDPEVVGKEIPNEQDENKQEEKTNANKDMETVGKTEEEKPKKTQNTEEPAEQPEETKQDSLPPEKIEEQPVESKQEKENNEEQIQTKSSAKEQQAPVETENNEEQAGE